MKQQPKGWATAKIEALISVRSDGRLLSQGWSPRCLSEPAHQENEWAVLKTTAIQDGYFIPEENKKLPPQMSPRPNLEVQAGDLLLTCAGPRGRCGIICLVRATRRKLMISGKMYRFRVPEGHVSPEYIEYHPRHSDTQKAIDEMKTGISDSGLNLTHERFLKLPIAVPPFAEQRRIVAKIDSLSAKSKRARDHLDHIPRLVEKYKQAILASAFHGIEAESKESTLEQLAAHITSGSRDWSQYYDRGNCVFVLAGNIKPMAFDPEPKQYVDPPLHGADAKRTLIETGDLLFTIVGANTGDVCHVPSAVTNYFVCQSVALVRLREPARARFIELFLNTETAGKAQINKLIYGQGRPHLSFADLKRLRIPVIEVAKTQAFVQRVNAAFRMVDRLASEATSARKLIDNLDQSVLARAFRGELVPQDPNDEPASALLERIKVEREGVGRSKG